MSAFAGIEPRCARGLLGPFIELTRDDALHVRLRADGLADPNRIPMRHALACLEHAIRGSRDPSLGLRAASLLRRDGAGLLDFAVAACATFGESLALMFKYVRLVNEAADYSMEVVGRRAWVTLRSSIALTPAAADYQLAVVLLAMKRRLGTLLGFEARFAHPAPKDLSLYSATLEPARLLFEAAHDAVTFDARVLDVPQRSADPELLAALQPVLDEMAEGLPEAQRLTPRLRTLLIAALPSGSVSADKVARKLGMSRRGLGRHLELEGTTYRAELNELRRQLSLRYLESTQLDLRSIAGLLGYTHTSTFARSFLRAQGETPAAYRLGATVRA